MKENHKLSRMEQLNSFVAEGEALLASQARGVDAGALISAGVKMSVRVNALTQLNGVQKRDLVVAALLSVLEKVEKKEKERASPEESTAIAKKYDHLEQVVRSAVPSAIDAAIDAARGKLNLKKVRPSVLLRFCLCFSKQAVAVLNDVGLISDETEKKAELVLRKAEAVEEKVGEKLDSAAGAAGVDASVAPVAPVAEEKVMIENPMRVEQTKNQTQEEEKVNKEDTPQ